MQQAKNKYARDNKYILRRTNALAISLFLFIDCEPVLALETDSGQPAKALHIDVGQCYGIYTFPYGLLIEPRWSPYLEIHYESGNMVADLQSGLGYKFLNNAEFSAGPAIVYQYGRYESADSRYRGLGDIPAAPAPSLFFEWTAFAGGVDLFVETGQSIGPTSSRYETVEATIAYLLSSSWNGFIDLLITGGDARYTRSFYGVTPLQASRSGYGVYTPNSGLTTAIGTVGISYKYSKQWEIIADMGISQYLDAVASSPLIAHRKSPAGNILLSYKFQ